jgi:hypothetical protein
MKAGGMKLMQMQWDFPDKIRINNLNIPIINIQKFKDKILYWYYYILR